MDPFAALADPVRRVLLEDVARGPVRVVDLASRQPVSRPAVSRHLRVLVEAGLVTATHHGRERHYALAPSGLAPVTSYLAGLALGNAPVTTQALDALDTEVRRTTRSRSRGPRRETA